MTGEAREGLYVGKAQSTETSISGRLQVAVEDRQNHGPQTWGQRNSGKAAGAHGVHGCLEGQQTMRSGGCDLKEPSPKGGRSAGGTVA